MADELFFDDWNTGSDLNASDVLQDMTPAAPVGGTAPSGSSWFSDLVKGVGAVAQEVAKYKRTTLPNGTSIYQRIDPRTGLPIPNSYTATSLGGISPVLLIGGGLVLFLLLKKR